MLVRFRLCVITLKLTIPFIMEAFTFNFPLSIEKTELDKESQPISRVLSRAIIHLGCISLYISSDLPEPSADHTIRFLFGLAPSGVCHAIVVTNTAVRSYRTISPLPINWRYLSVALSVDSRPPGITWHCVLWSPDFPPHSKE